MQLDREARLSAGRWRFIRRAAAVLAAAAATVEFAGCAWLGPETIRSGRPAYNDAILTTNDEQLLQNIVRLRFGDSMGFLTVSSVTANVSLSAHGAVNIGAGPSENYAGNLVPIAGALTAEQNPTISYTPVGGDRMLRQLTGETPLDLTILLINATHPHGHAWMALVRRANNLRNPDFVDPPKVDVDVRFVEAVDLASHLQQRGLLYWARLAGTQTDFAMVLHSYTPHNVAEVERLLELFGIARPLRQGDDVVVPVRLIAGSPPPGELAIETRSLFELMRIAAADIELPADLDAVATRFPRLGPAGKSVRILSAPTRPSRTRTAVEYRGRWYYIEQTDEASKQWFTMLQLLTMARVPESVSPTPMLTIPVTGRR